VYDATFQTDPPRPFKLSTFCIPTKPGWSRAIIQTLSATTATMKKEEEEKDEKADETTTTKATTTPTKKKKTKKSLVAIIFSKLPPWAAHQLTNIFLDSDMAFLHFQERERQRSNNYFIPAPADRCIAALQQWFKKHVDLQNDTAFFPLPPSPSSRLELFDRYSQHTSHCKICQAGLKSLQKWRRRTYVTLAMSLLVGLRFLLARVVVVLCLAILPMIQKLESSFRQGDYKHYEKK
jgi:hypothetical protein